MRSFETRRASLRADRRLRRGLQLGAIVAAVATAHRELAFDVCRALVETVKAELPVWKREVLRDGSHVWVGL